MFHLKKFSSASLVQHKPQGVEQLEKNAVIVSPSGGGSGRQQLQWSSDLHDRATPKGVLKVMGVPGLTIFHMNSHLQDCNFSSFLFWRELFLKLYILSRRKSLERACVVWILLRVYLCSLPETLHLLKFVGPWLSLMRPQVNEALRIQMEVQKRLHEQIEVQKQLQIRIEAQGKYLEKIIEEQQKLGGALKAPKAVPSADDKGNSLLSECLPDAPAESSS
ncbi:hypothetical protein Patl1_32246 [Pistacia atlantica]|uniref:Uncharacterized protein n=1 Tax=Pistacia atlantica TaxID=434234 RepID=A0ACC1ARM9_9ROSI|nr:hypothetical protein Patl1_32246 [Pistacia atlantica]